MLPLWLFLRPPTTPLAAIALYLWVRLTFWSVAIVIDGCGLVRAGRRAWNLARGNWWRLAAMMAMSLGARWAAGRWAPAPYVGITASWFLDVWRDAALAMMYLQRVGSLPRAHPTIGEMVAEHAALRRGVGELVSRPVD